LENIAAGQDWGQTIEKGLMQASALVYVASKHSRQSRWMDEELRAFLEKQGRVIPIVMDDEGASHLPLLLRRFQWADFRGLFEPALRSLLDGIRGLQGASPVATPKAKSKGYVFRSYAGEDSEFVGELKTFLKKQSCRYWDFRESERDYQADYSLELESLIRNAAGTLSVISPEWKRSPTALQELHFSREIGTPVFLLRIRNPGPTLAIAGMTHIDFVSKRREEFARLDAEMNERVCEFDAQPRAQPDCAANCASACPSRDARRPPVSASDQPVATQPADRGGGCGGLPVVPDWFTQDYDELRRHFFDLERYDEGVKRLALALFRLRRTQEDPARGAQTQ
jgi:hypothetical protein